MADTGNRELYGSLEGATYGGFRIVHRIATGGMGTVYLAFRAGMAGILQPCAIKIIHPHLALDQEFVEMFVDEARIASCIHHPSVCKVLDFGTDQGTYYLAMEYVLGETWASTLRVLQNKETDPRVAPALLAYVIAQACEGLHAAHEATSAAGAPLQIVHRDVSPHNIFIGYDGSVRVLDFGIASAVDRLHTTRAGTVKGRFSYMSPEHMRGEHVDRRSDIWSLGVMLREGLTGRSVFRRQTDAETITAVTQLPLPPWDHQVPAALQAVVERAMQRDPAQRYATAREMGQELTSYLMSLDPSAKVGMAEASQWMHRMFARHVDEKRALLQSAAAGFASTANDVGPLPVAEGSVGAAAAAEALQGEQITTPASRTPAEPRVSPARETRASWRSAPGKWVAIPLALSLVSVGFWWGGSRAAEEQSGRREAVRSAAAGSSGSAAPATLPPVARPSAVAPVRAHEQPPTVGDVQITATAPSQETAVPGDLGAGDLRASPGGTGQPASGPTLAGSSTTMAGAGAGGAVPGESTRQQAVAGMGVVNIACSNGWADVYLGMRKLGTTPGRFTLPAGPHVLAFRALGTGPRQLERVTVAPGGIARLRVTLR